MGLHRTSDNLSRCDPSLYSNIYDTRKRPDLNPEALSNPHPIHKDTIEISHDKLKEDALNRLRHTTTKTISQNGFMRIGKYLFIAIAFPPYLLIYGLPKWVIVEGLPALAALCTTIFEKIKQKTKKQTEAVIQKTSQAIEFLKHIARELMKPVVRLVMNVRQGIERFRVRVNHFFNQVKAKSKKALNAPSNLLTERFKRIRNKLKDVKDWANQKIESSREVIQKGMEWIKEVPMLMFGWGQAQFQQIAETAVSWKERWVNRYRTSQSRADKATHWISQRCNSGKERLKQFFEPLTSFFKLQLMPRWRRFQEACGGRFGKMAEFFNQKQRKALTYLQEKQERLKKFSYRELLDRLFSNALMKSLPLRVQEWLKKWLYRPFVESVLSRILKVFFLGSALVLNVIQKVIQGVAKCFGWVPRVVSQWIGYFRRGFGLCVWAFDTGMNYLFTGLRKGIYYMLLFAVMAGIICTLLMRSMARLTDYTIKKFSFKMEMMKK